MVVNEVDPQNQKRFEDALGYLGWTWHSSDEDRRFLILDTGFSTLSLRETERSEQRGSRGLDAGE